MLPGSPRSICTLYKGYICTKHTIVPVVLRCQAAPAAVLGAWRRRCICHLAISQTNLYSVNCWFSKKIFLFPKHHKHEEHCRKWLHCAQPMEDPLPGSQLVRSQSLASEYFSVPHLSSHFFFHSISHKRWFVKDSFKTISSGNLSDYASCVTAAEEAWKVSCWFPVLRLWEPFRVILIMKTFKGMGRCHSTS